MTDMVDSSPDPGSPGRRFRAFVALLGCAALVGCSPALDWRDAHPAGVDLLLTFPCKPRQVTQQVLLGGRPASMRMTGCVADGMTFALASADVGSAQQVAPALATLRASVLANVHGTATALHPSAVPHATAGLADAVEMDVSGHVAPGARPVHEHVVLFARGSHVYQATALAVGDGWRADAAATFAASIRLPAH